MKKIKLLFGAVALLALILVFWFGRGRSQEPLPQTTNTSVTAALGTPRADSAVPAEKRAYFGSDALEVLPLTTPQAAKLNTRIVLAKSISEDVKRGAGGNIFTFTTFEIVHVVKGQFLKKEFQLRLLGGRIGNEEVTGPLDLQFTPGEKFVLFLGADNADGYPTITPQALFLVRKSGVNGREVVQPTPTGLPLFHGTDGSRYTEIPEQLPLEDFLFSLEKLS